MPDDVEIILKVKADQQQAALTAAALRQHQSDVAAVSRSYDKLKQSADAAFPEVKRSTDLYIQGFIKAAEAAKRYEETIAKVGQTSQKLGNQSGGGTGGGNFGVEGLRRTGGALTQLGLGEIGIPIQRIGDIAQVSKEFGQLQEAVGLSGKSALTTAGALGGFAVAIGLIAVFAKNAIDTINAGKTALDAAISGQELYYKAIETGTTESIKAQITALKEQKNQADNLVANLKPQLKAAQDQAAKFGDQVGAGGLVRKIDETIGSSKTLQDQLDKQTKASADAEAGIKALNEALNNTQVILREAVANIIKQGDATKAAYLEDYQNSQLSADAIKKKIALTKANIEADQAEIEQLAPWAEGNQAIADKIKALTDDAYNLDNQLQQLNNIFLPAAEHAEALAAALKADDQAMLDRAAAMEADAKKRANADQQLRDRSAAGVKAEQEDQKKLTDAYIKRVQDIAQADQAYSDNRAKAATDYKDAEAAALSDKNDKIDQINSDFMASEIQATQDFKAEEIKADEQANKERIRRIEDLNDQLLDLAGRRDVAGFIQAQRQGEKDLARMAEGASDADKQRTADFTKARAQASKERQIQLDDVEKNFRKEEDKRKQAYRDQLSALDDKHAKELRAIDSAFAQQIAALQGNYAGLGAISAQYYSDMNAAALNFVNTQRAYLQSLYSGVSGGATRTAATVAPATTESRGSVSLAPATSRTTYAPATIRSYAAGGQILHDGLIMAHAGERVVRGVDNQGGGISVSIGNVNFGRIATPDDVERGKAEVVDAIATGIRKAIGGGR